MENVKFDKNGLICAIAQDYETGEVLMQAYMNAEALDATLKTGYAHYYSRSRQKLWKKGEESGHFGLVKSIQKDCDNDPLRIKAHPCGPVCHTGADTCFGETNRDDMAFITYLQDFIEQRKAEMPEGSYTSAMSRGDSLTSSPFLKSSELR